MEPAFLLLLLSLPSTAPGEAPPPTAVTAPWQDEFNDRMKAAGDDVEALWALYGWTQEDKKREKYAKRVLTKLLKVDPNHEGARTALGHQRFEDQWFETEKALDDYKKKRAKELGLVEWKGQWVEPADLPYLRKGLQKDRFGSWFDPEEKKKLDEGWTRQDLVWVSPEEKDKVAQGLWKCGDKWLSLEEADKFHAKLGSPWVIPKDRAQVVAFVERATALKALELANAAYFDVSKATNVTLDTPISFVLTRSQSQFLSFCDGDAASDHPTIEPRALSSQLRSAFADLWFDFEGQRYLGTGATFWDVSAEHADNYAKHDVRMAYGLSFMEFLDPATKAIEAVLANKRREVQPQFALDRINGRKLPEWIHWGVASYTSRWFVDSSVGQGGNARWAADWSAENIKTKGGLDPISTILEFAIAADNDNTIKLVNEAGLLVAFCVDGKNVELTKQWNAVFEALRAQGDVETALKTLRRTLLQCEAEIRAFAKL